MDNTQVVMALFKYVEDQYPVDKLSKRTLKRQSARRWAVTELCNRILDHPNTPPTELTENFLGQLTTMLYRMEEKNMSKDQYEPIYDALTTLLKVETYFNEVYV